MQKSEVQKNQKLPFPCKYNQVHLVRVNWQANLNTPYFNSVNGPLYEPWQCSGICPLPTSRYSQHNPEYIHYLLWASKIVDNEAPQEWWVIARLPVGNPWTPLPPRRLTGSCCGQAAIQGSSNPLDNTGADPVPTQSSTFGIKRGVVKSSFYVQENTQSWILQVMRLLNLKHEL